jgi:hypothetical protein
MPACLATGRRGTPRDLVCRPISLTVKGKNMSNMERIPE